MTNPCTCKAEHWQPHADSCPAKQNKRSVGTNQSNVSVQYCAAGQHAMTVRYDDCPWCKIVQLRGNLSLAEDGLASAMQEIQRLQAESDAWDKLSLVQLHQKIERAQRIMLRAVSWLQIKEAAFATHKGKAIIEEMQWFVAGPAVEPSEVLTPIERLLVEWWSTDMDNAELFNRSVRLSPKLAEAMNALPEKIP